MEIENATYNFNPQVDTNQKPRLFAVLTCLFSNISQLVNKNCTHPFSMKYCNLHILH